MGRFEKVILSALSAVFFTAAMQGMGFPFAVFFFLAPALIALEGFTRKKLFLFSIIFSTASAAAANTWLFHSLSGVFRLDAFSSGLIYFVYCLAFFGIYNGLFYTASITILSALKRFGNAGFLISAAAVSLLWAAAEYFRGMMVPAMNLGTASSLFYEYKVMIQGVGIIGEHLLSAVFVSMNFILYIPLKKIISHEKILKPEIFISAAAAVPLVLNIVYGYAALQKNYQPAKNLSALAVQGYNPADKKWKPEHSSALLENYIRLTTENLTSDTRIVFWPETVLNFYPAEKETLTERVRSYAAAEKLILFSGGPEKIEGPGGYRYYNSVYKITSAGAAPVYRKERLVPFAEYSPAEFVYPVFKKLIGENQFSSFKKNRPVELNGLRIGMAICFESAFPDIMKNRATDADLVVVFSDDVWLGDTPALKLHLASTVLRAVENRKHVLLISNSGISAYITPRGDIISQIPFGQKGIIRLR